MHAAAHAALGLSEDEFNRITDDVALDEPVLGDPEWSPELLLASELGPPEEEATEPGGAARIDAIPIESVQELAEEFRRFLSQYGIATGSHEELVDLLAAALSSQFVIMAGPSGSGKSLMPSALAAFFAPPERRRRLEASRLLASRGVLQLLLAPRR